MKQRVVVAMSGGVDSSVAAALLKEAGYEAIGMTMCFNLADAARKRPACCSLQGIEDAKRVAHKLNIRHYVLNMQKLLEEKVIKNFCSEYLRGRTPNPCVRCNQYLKFGALLKKALSLDTEFIATGHYARITKSHAARRTPHAYALKKAKDKLKDQSYFLYRLKQSQLKHTLFPLGEYNKQQVRALAKKFELPVAEKLASQDICFLPDNQYRVFLEQRLALKPNPGPVIDKQGKVLGRHKGIAYYTIGQREGLGIALGYPAYITQIDYKNNRITVGNKEDASKREFLLTSVHFISRPIKKKVVLNVKIRYNHKESCAEVWPQDNKIMVKFVKQQFAITPGQSAVFYSRDTVVGGGVIEKVLG